MLTTESKILTMADFLTVGEAAKILGVSVSTLRNWDRRGKLRPLRHPINGYRIYRAEEISLRFKIPALEVET